jgi:hypothetical protein
MRMERDHGRWTAQLARAIDDAADDLLMSDMHAVEISDRGHAAARQIGLAQWILKNQHRARSVNLPA